jgi:hypothetical protein
MNVPLEGALRARCGPFSGAACAGASPSLTKLKKKINNFSMLNFLYLITYHVQPLFLDLKKQIFFLKPKSSEHLENLFNFRER